MSRPKSRSKDTIEAVAAFALPGPSAVPLIRREDVERLHEASIDPRAAFLIAQLDGKTTISDLVDMGTMRRMEVLEVLTHLAEIGLVYFDEQ